MRFCRLIIRVRRGGRLVDLRRQRWHLDRMRRPQREARAHDGAGDHRSQAAWTDRQALALLSGLDGDVWLDVRPEPIRELVFAHLTVGELKYRGRRVGLAGGEIDVIVD
jgi:hypothetical protein